MTIVEVLIASSLLVVVGLGMAATTIMCQRLFRSVNFQQRSLRDAKASIEVLNQEIRLATTPLTVLNSSGIPAQRGNRVQFRREGETTVREIRIESTDADFQTPWDNRLIYDPDISTGGDEDIVAVNVIPFDLVNGAFAYSGALTALQAQFRVGDPAITEADNATLFREANFRSGPGLQGVEVNISIAPRN